MMSLTRYLVIAICALIFLANYQAEAQAAQKPQKEPTTATSKLPANPLLPPASHPSKDSTVSVQEQKQIKKEGVPQKADARPAPRKTHGKGKTHKKMPLKAVVQPRHELLYHGVLENPQRYDPRLNSKTSGVPNPQTPELIHDHFQELDRNQDGRIDPVERAFGRLDMDRDLDSRQPQ